MRPGIVTIRYTSRWPYNPISPIIAVAGGSSTWSHTMAIIGERAYEANMLHGCRAISVDVAMEGIKRYQDMPVWVPDLDAASAFGEAQDGKSYDWAGVLGIPFLMSEDWHDDSKWWCSEHNFALLMAGGTVLLDPAEKHRVTPNDLRQCYWPKSPLQYALPGRCQPVKDCVIPPKNETQNAAD